MDKHIIYGGDFDRITNISLGQLLLLILKTHDDNVLLVDGFTEETLTAKLLLDKAIHLAKWLQSENIGINDVISINSENRLEFIIIPVAAFLIGATFSPLNPDYTQGELKHVLNLTKPKIIFCSSRTIDKMVKYKSNYSFIKKIILFGNKPYQKNILMFKNIIAKANGENIDDNFQPTDIDTKNTVATILYSSGTTGLPKGVMCTHDNMTSYIDIMRNSISQMLLNDDPNDSLIGLAPFFHSLGFMLMFLNILRGKKLIILSKFKTKPFLESIVKYNIKRLIVPPSVMLVLLKHPLTKQYDLSHIEEIKTGAAPMGKEMERKLKEKFNVNHVSQGYGMTETTLSVLNSPYNHTKYGSVGKIVPGMLVKVINEKGESLGCNQEGELLFKGPLIMKGYFNDENATNNTIDKDGWLHTGDVGYYDEDGFFFIVDRLKELIKFKGFQVAPAELEALLTTHRDIDDAAVIGLPDDAAGELPLAFVVKTPQSQLNAKDVEKFVADNVSPQKQLRGGVIFIDSIPRNPSGKILRRKLRENAKTIKSKL